MNDIINSNLNSLLDRAEEPEKIIRLVIQEMEDTLVEVRSDAARTIAEKKKQQRRIDRLGDEILEWERKAELAVSKGREDLARAALAEKNSLERGLASLTRETEELEVQLSKLNEDIGNLQNKLDDAKARQKTLAMKHDTVARRLQTREKLHDRRIDDALSRFDDLERKKTRQDKIQYRRDNKCQSKPRNSVSVSQNNKQKHSSHAQKYIHSCLRQQFQFQSCSTCIASD
jgi:phage shock protein A